MMSYNLQIDQYRRNTALNAQPLQLLIQLYDGAIKFIEQGKNAMFIKDFYEQNKNLQKAQSIIVELRVTLDYEQGKEFSKNLCQIYTVLEDKIVEANALNDPTMLNRIKHILLELRSAWSQIS